MTAPDQMSFWEHLQELRTRLLWSLGIVAAAFAVTYALRFRIWAWAQAPFLDLYKAGVLAHARAAGTPPPATFEPFAYTSLTEPFFSMMRLALWAAAFLAAPFLFHQLWAFIRPGLHEKERRWGLVFVVVTSLCFLGGAAFAYFNAFRILGNILFGEALQAGLRTNLHVETYLDLFLYTIVGTGLLFELPVLVFFLARFRILTAARMLRYWRHATLGIVVASAFLTPGDVVVTTVFFSAVLLGLYAISILVALLAAPKARN